MKTVIVSSRIENIGKLAFGNSSVTKLVLQTHLLGKKTRVRGCLKQSKVKTLQVAVGSKKQNRAFKKKHKKAFVKKTVGRKAVVTV